MWLAFGDRGCALTSHSSRRRFAARLNLGVRLLGNTNVGFKQRVLLQSGFDSSGQFGCSKRLPAIRKNASVRFKAASCRSKALVRRCGSGECLGAHCSEILCKSCSCGSSPGVRYNGNSKRLQPNQSFKLMSLRGADFCGNVYHNAAPLRATA